MKFNDLLRDETDDGIATVTFNRPAGLNQGAARAGGRQCNAVLNACGDTDVAKDHLEGIQAFVQKRDPKFTGG